MTDEEKASIESAMTRYDFSGRDGEIFAGVWPIVLPMMISHRLRSGTWLSTKGPDAGRRYS